MKRVLVRYRVVPDRADDDRFVPIPGRVAAVSRGLLCLIIVTIGCAGTDLETEIAALRAADSLGQARIMAGDGQGLMAVFAKDANNYPPGGPIEGGETIQLGFEDRFALPGMAGSRDLAYTVATEEFTSEDENGELTTVRSRRLTIWKKQPNGRWQIVENIWNYGR
jgi:ketosteroid isomerase-like protein